MGLSKTHFRCPFFVTGIGVEPDKAKAAMLMGAMAQRRSDFVNKLEDEKEIADMRKAQLLEAARHKAAALARNIQLDNEVLVRF